MAQKSKNLIVSFATQIFEIGLIKVNKKIFFFYRLVNLLYTENVIYYYITIMF